MKKLLIGVVVIVVLAAAALGYALWNLDALAQRFRPDIERIAGQTLKTDVQIGELQAQVFPKAQLALSSLTVGEQKKTPEDFRLKEFRLGVDLMQIITGKLAVNEITLVGVQAQITKQNGKISVAGLPSLTAGEKKKKGEGKRAEKQPKAPKEKAQGSGLPAGFSIALEAISLEDSSITFDDKDLKEVYELNELALTSDLTIKGDLVSISSAELGGILKGKGAFSVDSEGISFNLKDQSGTLAQLSAGSKHEIDGKNASASVKLIDASFSLKPQQVAFQRLEGEADYPELGPLSFTVSDVKTEKQLISAPSITAECSKFGLKLTAEANYHLKKQLASFELKRSTAVQHGVPIAVSAKGSASPEKLNLERYSVEAASGEASGSADYALTGKNPFQAAVEAKGILIEKAMKLALGENTAQLRGTLAALSADIGGQMKGAMMESLIGGASVEIKDGEFLGGNLATMALQSITELPFLAERFFEEVPQEYKDELNAETTPIKLLTSKTAVRSSTLFAENFRLESTLFQLEADGTIGFDQSLDLNSKLRFNPVFSLALAEKTKELRGLLDENDRLLIPLRIKGTAAKPVVLPDLKELAKTAAGAKVKEKASELIGKALGSGDEDNEQGKAIVEGLGKAFGF